MAIAEAGSINYRLPQAQQFVPQQPSPEPIAPGQGQAMLPPPNEDLANVEGLTDKYYSTYGKLKSFVEDLNSQGIDVTKPDYADPAKQELFKTYKMMEADLMVTANALKNEQKFRNQINPQIVAGNYNLAQGVDQRTQLLSELGPEGAGYSTKLDPGVEQALKILAENPLTYGDRQRQEQYFSETSSELDNRINLAQSPVEKQRLQYQKDQLTKAYQATKLFSPSSRGSGTKQPIELDVLKRITNLAQGAWPDGTFKSAVVDGKPALVNTSFEGEKYGEETIIGKDKKERIVKRVVDKWVKYDDGTVEVRFKNTEKGEPIPPVVVSGTKGDEITANFISSNPKYGSATKMYQAARDQGYLDEASAAITESLLYSNAEQLKQSGVSDLQTVGLAYQDEVKTLLEDFDKLSAWSGDDFSTTTSDGKKIEVGSNKFKSGYYLKVDGVQKLNGVQPDEIISYLGKNTSYFDKVLNKSVSKPAEEIKAEELIKKYSK